MQKLIDFLIANWDSIVSYGSAIAGVSGWLTERKRRMRDNRDSDVAFWEKTIDRQNNEIARLETKLTELENRYEEKIQKLLSQLSEMSGKLAAYESHYHPHTHTNERHPSRSQAPSTGVGASGK